MLQLQHQEPALLLRPQGVQLPLQCQLPVRLLWLSRLVQR
jgi:hypothetical protein